MSVRISQLVSFVKVTPHTTRAESRLRFPGNLCSEKAMDYMRTEGRTEDSHLADLKTEFGGGWIKKLRSRSKASITPQSTGEWVNHASSEQVMMHQVVFKLRAEPTKLNRMKECT